MDNIEQQTDLNQNGRKYGEEMQSVLFDKSNAKIADAVCRQEM